MPNNAHQWTPVRKVRIGDKVYEHRACKRCHHDFVKTVDSEWRAVKVGVFDFQFLEAATSVRWQTECTKSQ